MTATTRQELHALIDQLSDDRLPQARVALGGLAADDPADPDERFLRRLRADGSLLSEPTPLSDDEHRRIHARQPVTIRGEAIADTIVRDRGGIG